MNRAIWYTPRIGRLTALLSARGWTWAELSRQSGRTRTHICRVLGGHHRTGAGLAADIAAALEVEIGEIWDVVNG
jgi:hypothetical protein